MSSHTKADYNSRHLYAKPAALARFILRCELWLHARLLPIQVRDKPLQQALKLAQPTPRMLHFKNLSPAYIVKAVRRTTRRPWLMRDRRCFRQGLLTYRYLLHTGHQPQLHFGVEPDVVTSDKVKAHCWVTLDGQTVIGESDIPYIEIHVHADHKAE